MIKQSLTYILIIFIILLTFMPHKVQSHLELTPFISAEHEKTRNAWVSSEREQDSKYKVMDNAWGIYMGAKTAVEELISDWSDQEQKIANNRTVTLENVSNALLSLVSTIVTKSPKAAYLPSVFNTYMTGKSTAEMVSLTLSTKDYLTAISESLSTMDAYLGRLQNTHPEYKTKYDLYLDACVAHIICRPISEGDPQIAYTKKKLNDAVNPAAPANPLNNGWVHPHDSKSQGTHTVYSKGDWSYSDLPKKYPCKGEGGQKDPNDKYRTPSEAFFTHREKCGKDDTEDIDNLLKIFAIGGDPHAWSRSQRILKSRSVEDGCGRDWYSCDANIKSERDLHKVKECEIMIPKKDGTSYNCPDQFRLCMPHERDHDESKRWNKKTPHSNTDNDGNASNNNENPIGTTPTTPDETPQQANITYTCGIHNGPAANESSDHKTTISGYSGTFYECQPHQTFGCGHTDLTSNAYTHRSESCPKNSSGQTCDYVSYYACSPHTHTYPKVLCGNAWRGPGKCKYGRVVSGSSTEHRSTCIGGHTYWSCNPRASAHHGTQTCTRSGCDVSFSKCTNGKGGCFSGDKEYMWHQS